MRVSFYRISISIHDDFHVFFSRVYLPWQSLHRKLSQFRRENRANPRIISTSSVGNNEKPQMWWKRNDFFLLFSSVSSFPSWCFIDPKSLNPAQIYDFLSLAINKTLLFVLHNHELNCAIIWQVAEKKKHLLKIVRI